MIDLHCHSSFSDGALSPRELILKAQKNHIQYLSLTDHDTVTGYPELNQAALDTEVVIVNGIELSTCWKRYDIHILGYQIHHTSGLAHVIEQQNNSRVERAMQMSASLALIGVEDAYNKACQLAGHGRIGRPHFAKLLVAEGKAKDIQSAFKQFLARGKRAYVPPQWISLQKAVEAIIASKGDAVIAHPLKYGLTRSKLHELINEFKEAGGVGIEVVSGEMTKIQIEETAALSLRFNLLASSGSDYHSDVFSRINLGRQRQLPLNCMPIWQEWGINT